MEPEATSYPSDPTFGLPSGAALRYCRVSMSTPNRPAIMPACCAYPIPLGDIAADHAGDGTDKAARNARYPGNVLGLHPLVEQERLQVDSPGHSQLA